MAMAQAANIHVPRVLAWNKHYDSDQNPVRSPYILVEDIQGTTLEREWHNPEMRGKPVATLLRKVLDNMLKQMEPAFPGFSQLGSIYFAEDFPSSSPLLVPGQVAANEMQPVTEKLRIGPIADMLWWRPFHDEPHLDRGPWDTLEECVRAAVLIERRAIERYRADPSSLAHTRSTLNDLGTIERLLDKVDVLAPHLQHAIERASCHPEGFMQNVFVHPNICSQDIMVPALTSNNAVERMLDPVMINWEGTVVLPYALQFNTPNLWLYKPSLFRSDGKPLLRHNGIFETPWPLEFDQMLPQEQEAVRAEHRLSMRHVVWNQLWLLDTNHSQVLGFGMQRHLHTLLPVILRACQDGPQALWHALLSIKENWDRDQETYGLCPFTFGPEELDEARTVREKVKKYWREMRKLMRNLNCSISGWVTNEDYEAALGKLDAAKRDWDESGCGVPFPFQKGMGVII
ncbi:hypothetical protein H1R20_g3071, partial [Candolleomyces eurysporus]